MKISTFILSFCGFCAFYICNADWIDELIEDYLGSDYEEIAPFISSVTAGTEEFDQMVRELSQSKRRWWLPSPLTTVALICCLALSVFLPCHVLHTFQGRLALKTALEFLKNFKKSATEKEEIQSIVTEFLEKKLKQFCGSKRADDVPVKLLWKGGTLVESSIHCNIKDESKLQHVQRRLLHSKLLFDSSSEKEDKIVLAPSTSETSTAKKMAEIRKMLESEQELVKLVNEGADVGGKSGETHGLRSLSLRKKQQTPSPRSDVSEEDKRGRGRPTDKLQKLSEGNSGNKTDSAVKEAENKSDSEWDVSPDPKLMNRIRLLESRLRLEELKNKNWINRMSRAEGILQQLNKQVERIEESRPMGTLTETLKITSTTNWAPSPQPRRNMRFTLVNQYPLFCMQAPYASLSELIKKEVGLPSPMDRDKNILQLPPSPQIPALPSPIVMPQSSFLSKFLFSIFGYYGKSAASLKTPASKRRREPNEI